MMDFKDPWVLIFIPVFVFSIYKISKRTVPATIRFSSLNLFSGLRKSWRVKLGQQRFWLRILTVVFFVLALAGPRKVLEETVTTTEGINIVLAVDASGSMAAEDFKVNNRRENRLNVVKNVVREFIRERKSDRIGLVAFAALAYTVCPLTTDYDWLTQNLDRIQLGLIKDGTAVGSAIATSLARLKDSQAKSKIIILLTDGISNSGRISPLDAAKAAKAFGVKIYTIGAGSKGVVPFPVRDLWGNTVYQQVRIDLDEKTLKEIASITKGLYFRATDTESLRHIYQEIDNLEKTKIEQKGYKEYKEFFGLFLLTGLGLLVLDIILYNTVLLKIP